MKMKQDSSMLFFLYVDEFSWKPLLSCNLVTGGCETLSSWLMFIFLTLVPIIFLIFQFFFEGYKVLWWGCNTWFISLIQCTDHSLVSASRRLFMLTILNNGQAFFLGLSTTYKINKFMRLCTYWGFFPGNTSMYGSNNISHSAIGSVWWR